VISVYHILWCDTLLAGTLCHRYTVFVRTAHEEYLLALETEIAHIDVGRYIHTSQVTDMYRTVGIGQCRGYGRSLKFSFHTDSFCIYSQN
jgi:hypothetical protein